MRCARSSSTRASSRSAISSSLKPSGFFTALRRLPFLVRTLIVGKFEEALVGFERFGAKPQVVVAGGQHEVKSYGRVGRFEERFEDGDGLAVMLLEIEARGKPLRSLAVARIE